MQEAKGISNAQTLFGMGEIPCDNRIRTLLYGVPPTVLDALFASIFRGLVAGGYLTEWRALNGTVLLALDGVQYFSSTVIHCPNCSTAQHTNGTVSYSHQALTPVLVAPCYDKVIPLMPEFITPQMGMTNKIAKPPPPNACCSTIAPATNPWGSLCWGMTCIACNPSVNSCCR